MSEQSNIEVVYIAGKISGLPLNAARAKFMIAEAEILKKGNRLPLNPMSDIDITDWSEAQPWEYYMKRAIFMLVQADTVYFLNDWTESRGAKFEHAIAKTLKMKIEYQP